MKPFLESEFVKQMKDITFQAYNHNWDERNGGNISLRIDSKDLSDYSDVSTIIRNIKIGFDAREVIGQYYLVTGTGKYFRNISNFPERNLGLVQIAKDGKSVDLLWGFTDGGEPTSEFPAHLMTHCKLQKNNSDKRCVMHCHPTNLVAMSFTLPLQEKHFSRILWKMQAESIVVFPEGIGIIPYMTPGTNEIGLATSDKLMQYKIVLWPHHGAFAVGSDLDETFGLIETVEKAASIYTIIKMHGGRMINSINDNNLVELSKRFSVRPNKAFL